MIGIKPNQKMLSFLRNLIVLLGLIAIATAQIGVNTGLGVGPARAGASKFYRLRQSLVKDNFEIVIIVFTIDKL